MIELTIKLTLTIKCHNSINKYTSTFISLFKKNDKLNLLSLNIIIMMLTLMTFISALRGLLTILHAYLVADFVHSRPPGRKMVNITVLYFFVFIPTFQVTSDINVYACVFSDLGKCITIRYLKIYINIINIKYINIKYI